MPRALAARLLLVAVVLTAASAGWAYDATSSRDWGGDSDGESWFRLGARLHGEERWDEAVAAFGRALEGRYRRPASACRIACGYARKNDRERALVWLERALAHGFRPARSLRSDPDLGSIRSDPRFLRLAEPVDRPVAALSRRARG